MKQLQDGFNSLKVYDGGSKHSDLIKSITGTDRNFKVSIPRNQMFVVYETTSSKGGFNASILENSIC